MLALGGTLGDVTLENHDNISTSKNLQTQNLKILLIEHDAFAISRKRQIENSVQNLQKFYCIFQKILIFVPKLQKFSTSTNNSFKKC